MKRISSRRPGFALAVALAAIVIIGGLIAGVFYASTQEYRIGRNSILQARALSTAEQGLNAVLVTDDATSGWNPAWNNEVAGKVFTRVYQTGDVSAATVRVVVLGNSHFQVTSEGVAGPRAGAQGRRNIATLVALAIPQINVRGALTTRGATKIGGSSYINGNDTTVQNWNCPPADSALPGIATGDSTLITTSGCNSFNCVAGSPQIRQDTAASNPNTYTTFGDINFDELAAMATKSKTYPSGTTLNGMAPSYDSTRCKTADPNNWGDPKRTAGALAYCANYYPIIHALGDLKVVGGIGQGILLVEGNLEVDGGFEFYGPVIVKGVLKTEGTGGHFNGGVLAENVDLEQNTMIGNAVVRYSSCAVNQAVKGSATPMLATGRAWAQLY